MEIMARYLIFRNIFEKISIRRARSCSKKQRARIGLDRQRRSPPVDSPCLGLSGGGTDGKGLAAIRIKGRKTLNDERRPVPFLKFALADTNERTLRRRGRAFAFVIAKRYFRLFLLSARARERERL